MIIKRKEKDAIKIGGSKTNKFFQASHVFIDLSLPRINNISSKQLVNPIEQNQCYNKYLK